jgi:antitoxin component YwqK of YwqJK toxin-antitoxin module
MKRVPNDSLVYDDGLMWLDDEPFTGIGYSLNANGDVDGEIEYRDGLEWGLLRTWYLPGLPFQESHLFMGTKHGKAREWYNNGQLKEEGDYELGFALRKKRWDADGYLIESYELKETDPEYKRLESFREIYKDDLAREKPDEPAG